MFLRCSFHGKENLEIFVVAALEAVKVWAHVFFWYTKQNLTHVSCFDDQFLNLLRNFSSGFYVGINGEIEMTLEVIFNVISYCFYHH